MGKVVILRAVSGAGKTTFANKFYPDAVKCSADDFFMDGGEYEFDAQKLGDAHGACLREFDAAIHVGVPLIVVDNTNTELWEIAPYRALALAFGYEVEIVTIVIDPAVAFGRNSHGVPEHVVEAQHSKLDKTWIPVTWNGRYIRADTYTICARHG